MKIVNLTMFALMCAGVLLGQTKAEESNKTSVIIESQRTVRVPSDLVELHYGNGNIKIPRSEGFVDVLACLKEQDLKEVRIKPRIDNRSNIIDTRLKDIKTDSDHFFFCIDRVKAAELAVPVIDVTDKINRMLKNGASAYEILTSKVSTDSTVFSQIGILIIKKQMVSK